jgi:acyl carrier protein
MPEEISKDEIRAMLIKSLMLKMPPEEIGDDTPLFSIDGLGLDSIDALELVVSMEKTFGVGVANSGVAQVALRDVNSLHEYINGERAKKSA